MPAQHLCWDAGAMMTFGWTHPTAALACRESWRGSGCASGFMAATVRRNDFPRPLTSFWAFLAQQNRRASRSSTLLRPLRDAARPYLALWITDKAAMGATLIHRKETSSWQTSAPSPHKTAASPARFAP
jgi:hypothetical protein